MSAKGGHRRRADDLNALHRRLQGERRGQHRVGVVSEKKNACAPFLNGPAGLLAANDLLWYFCYNSYSRGYAHDDFGGAAPCRMRWRP